MIPCKFNKKGGFSVCFAVHLARNSCKSVPGVSSCRPPGTVFPQKRSRWHFPAVYLARRFLSLCDVGAFQQDKLAVFSMERVAVCTPAVGKCVHLSENHDVSRMVQLRVSHVWTHLQYQNRLAGAYRAHLSLRVCISTYQYRCAAEPICNSIEA